MGNFVQRAKQASLFFSGVIIQHYVDKILNSKEIESGRLAQALRDQQAKALTEKVQEMKVSLDDVKTVWSNVKEQLKYTNSNTKPVKDELLEAMTAKTSETQKIGEHLNNLLKENSLNDQELQKAMGEGVSKILNNSYEIQKFIDEYNIGDYTGEIKKFIGNSNFNLDYIYSYLDSLSLLQESALLHICIFITILLTLTNIFATLFANEIINYFDLENKYPSISGFLKLRAKFQKYYLIWNLIILLVLILGAIAINILVFVVS